MRLIDTHCHLNDKEAFPEPKLIVQRALDAGVEEFIVIGVDEETSLSAVALAEQFAGVWAVVGWHPNYTSSFTLSHLDVLRELLNHPRVVALGEIGLDYHWTYATKDQQYAALYAQLELSKEFTKPIVFHCREAYPDLLDVLENAPAPNPVFHCFAGDRSDAKRAIKLGAWFGIDGPVTYKKNDALRALIRELPRDRILLETDAPWLTPHPFRGKPNEPSLLPLINAEVARSLGITEQECTDLTTANAQKCFAI